MTIVAPTLHDVDRAISVGVRGLRFSDLIEHRFEADTGPVRRSAVIFNNAIGLASRCDAADDGAGQRDRL